MVQASEGTRVTKYFKQSVVVLPGNAMDEVDLKVASP